MQKLLMLGSLLLLTACGGTVDAQGDSSAKQSPAPAAMAADQVVGQKAAGEKVGGCCGDTADACCSEAKATPAAACCADEKTATKAADGKAHEGCEEACAGACGACPPESKPAAEAPQ